MPPADPMMVLLVSEHAEDVKRITIALRTFYPGCRVEAVYTEAEALDWASKDWWHLLLVDERLSPRPGMEVLPDLRRRAPSAAILFLTETSDPAVSVQATRGGADCALYTKSAGFLGELTGLIREVLEKRELRQQRDVSRSRYLRLVELLPDLVYELDPEGRFGFISENVTPLLGYRPQELIGVHFSAVILPLERARGDFLVNERRTGGRATRNERVRLMPKPTERTPPAAIDAEVSAKGLYDQRNQLLGTIGVARILPVAGPGEPPAGEGQASDAVRSLREAFSALAREAGLSVEEAEADPAGLVRLVRATPRPPAAREAAPEEPAVTPAAPRPAPSERRAWPRYRTPIEATLSHDGLTWTGQVRDLGLGGLSLELEGTPPVRSDQAVQLGLVSSIAVLNLTGIVRTVRPLDRRRVGTRTFPAVGVVIELTEPGREERMVLSSLLEGLRDQIASVRLTVLLQPAGREEVVVEAAAELAGPIPRVPLEPFPPETEPHQPAEQRFGIRVNFVMAVGVQPVPAGPERASQDGRTLNLGLSGACLRLQAEEALEGRRLELSFTIPPSTPGFADAQERGPIRARVTGAVAWVRPDPLAAPPGGPPGIVRVGVRFLHVDLEGEALVRRLVRGLLTSPLRVHGADGSATLLSTFMACQAARGRSLAVFYDRLRKPLPPGAPLAVIAPDFGETKRDYVFLAYALAANGFHVLRCDYTDHVGESSGAMHERTLSGMQRDLAAVLRFAGNSWPASPLVVVAPGLGARVALRTVIDQWKVRLLVLLAGVMDVRSALQGVHGEDLVAAHLATALTGTANVLGMNVDAARWLGDLVEQDYADLASTVRDARRLTTPTVLFAADRDPRTALAGVKEVESALGSHAKQTYLLPDPAQRLHEDPGKDRALYRQVVAACVAQCYPAAPQEDVRAPSLREVHRQRSLELDRLRALGPAGAISPLPLLAPSLEAPRGAEMAGDLWRLLDDVYRLMGELTESVRVLDACCGAGQFGRLLVVNQAYRAAHAAADGRGPLYVGIDADRGTVSRTQAEARSFVAQLRATLGPPRHPAGLPSARFGVVDPTRPLPFKTGSFDRVVCLFALNGLLDPLAATRELARVLAPGGRLIVTSVKPHADFTRLYRNVLAASPGAAARAAAGRLLAGWGALAEAERNGTVRFFDQRELLALLSLSDLVDPRVHPTLANQAYVVVGESPG